jgi:ribonuclease D
MTTKFNRDHDAPSTITHEEIGNLPLHSYSGKIDLIHDPGLLPAAFEQINRHDIVGFDTETRPSFKKGQLHKVSLLQIATMECVYLIRLQYTGFTKEIKRFLESGEIIKTGVGIRDDLNAINRVQKFKPKGFVDLVPLAREAGLKVESVKKLTGLLLGFRISKSAQTSNWEAKNLTKKQIEYAATDAWVCLELYQKLSGE